jgi:Tol biopolymer transport system component
VHSNGAQGNDDSHFAAISADGRYVAFHSDASNLVAGDTNNARDIFVRDRQMGTTERVSVHSNGAQGNDWSFDPAISDDGRYVAFESRASNLAPGYTNGTVDIFVRDRLMGTTERVSVDSNGTQANYDSYSPDISGDGRYVAFQSLASNLVSGDTNGVSDVFVRDRGSTPTPTSTTSPTPTPSPTGSGGPQLMQGDVDCDGDADAVDALKVLRHVASLPVSPSPGCPEMESQVAGHPFGDVDCDGDVDAVDALRILRYVAGLDPGQPPGCTPIGGPL